MSLSHVSERFLRWHRYPVVSQSVLVRQVDHRSWQDYHAFAYEFRVNVRPNKSTRPCKGVEYQIEEIGGNFGREAGRISSVI